MAVIATDKAKHKNDKGNDTSENPTSWEPSNLTEEIAQWMEGKNLLYGMEDTQDKALRRHLWEGKAAEYGMDCKEEIHSFFQYL